MAIKMTGVEARPLKEFVCSVPFGADLLASLKDLIKQLGVHTGTINLIGALRSATLQYYIQDEKRFHTNKFEEPLEIVAGIGNIATLNGELVVHCHLVLARKDGSCLGGHLVEGSKVFAAEVHIRELYPPVERHFDPVTGLNLQQV
jgi:predicted DNA-binding protein with PD1-like motif